MKDLNALHVFMAVYQTGSTKQAAIRLGRSQSYVSKVLATLREELKDPLFIRTSVSLTPTNYANEIAPKLQNALHLVDHSLQPNNFDPQDIKSISIHLLEPYVIGAGKEIINNIRQFTDANIELKCWSPNTEQLIQEGKVDLGFHLFKERSQHYNQTPLVSMTGQLVGKKNTELVKYISPNINEHIDYFKQIDNEAHATIFVDHCSLLNQLMDEYQTYKLIPIAKNDCVTPQVSLAIITKATQNNSPKNKWLRELLTPILKNVDITLL